MYPDYLLKMSTSSNNLLFLTPPLISHFFSQCILSEILRLKRELLDDTLQDTHCMRLSYFYSPLATGTSYKSVRAALTSDVCTYFELVNCGRQLPLFEPSRTEPSCQLSMDVSYAIKMH